MSKGGHQKMMGRLGNPYTDKEYKADQAECKNWRDDGVCRGPGRNCTNGICPMGIRMHRFEIENSEKEQQWDRTDKNSSRNKDVSGD